MQLVLPFVDAAVAGHERTDFLASFLNSLRKVSSDAGNPGLREVGFNLGIDEEDSFDGIGHTFLLYSHKDRNFFP